jgi:hypothetical protein
MGKPMSSAENKSVSYVAPHAGRRASGMMTLASSDDATPKELPPWVDTSEILWDGKPKILFPWTWHRAMYGQYLCGHKAPRVFSAAILGVTLRKIR